MLRSTGLCLTRRVPQDFAEEIEVDKEDLFDDSDGFSVWSCSTSGSDSATGDVDAISFHGERAR